MRAILATLANVFHPWQLLCAAGLALVLASLTRAENTGPDIDPANLPKGFWDTNGFKFDFWTMDANNKCKRFFTKAYYAWEQLDGTHCKDGAGVAHGHFHFEKDFDDVQAADRYWDARFDAPNKTKRIASAAIKINCHAYALAAVGKGTYNYWIDDNPSTKTNLKPAFLEAFETDTVPQPKDAVITNDVLLYTAPNPKDWHSTVIHSAVNKKVVSLRWRFDASGVYELTKCTFDTPKMVGPSEEGKTAQELMWKWDDKGAGSEKNLYKLQARTKKK